MVLKVVLAVVILTRLLLKLAAVVFGTVDGETVGYVMLLDGLTQQLSENLQKLQNRAIRVIMGLMITKKTGCLVVGGVADVVNMVLLVLMRGGAVTDFASCGGCCAVRGDSVVGGAANILYFLFN
ncbi:unnamed protein product [Porites evermanni]|uniref:Secreted protein n=1 Tax=Porites evermanni TaxID=104178 RepID=A0ABN8LZ84_9CNID|nr:unnamed protein product [Porites evermanni]